VIVTQEVTRILIMGIFFSFCSIKKTEKLVNKNNNDRTSKISVSANINPELWFILSKKGLTKVRFKGTVMVTHEMPPDFRITYNDLFQI